MERNSKVILIFFGILTLLAVALIYFSGSENPSNKIDNRVYNVNVGVNPVKGNIENEIVIIEFSDFQCPACKASLSIIESILEEYDIAFYYRNFPLSIHKNSYGAALAAQAANKQGRFWEYHDILFENQNNLEREDLINYAEQLGLDLDKFIEDMDSEEIKEIVDRDISDARNLGVRATPTFFINGRKVVGGDEVKIREIIEGLI